jgi:hypothetical protein
MADSETSRTLPSDACRKRQSRNYAGGHLPLSVNHRNLLTVAANLLMLRTAELGKLAGCRQPGPKSAAQLWQEWYVVHQRRERVTRYQQKLETQVLAAAGGFPIAELAVTDQAEPVKVFSFAEIDRWKSRLCPDQLAVARSQLRQRRKQWKAADKKFGLSPALNFERDLADQEGIWARLLWTAKPRSIVEITAKLHCLITMEDPGAKSNEAPWSQLRKILEELIRLDNNAL